MTYDDLHTSLCILGLGERATLKEIKERYRKLVKQYHPDIGYAGDPEMIRQIYAAYRIVTSYVSGYHFSFSEKEYYEQDMEACMRRQYADDPFWGNR